MRIDKKKIVPMSSPLVGFGGEQVRLIGVITLPVKEGTAHRQTTAMIDFIVIDRPFAYNAIVGRPTLNNLEAIPSTVHLMMKFPTEHEVGFVHGNQKVPRLCYNATLKEPKPQEALTM